MDTSNRNYRRLFLRRCAFFGAASILAACSAQPPSAPSVAPTIEQLDTLLLTPQSEVAPQTVTPVVPTLPTEVPRMPAPPAAGPGSFAECGGRTALIERAQAEGELIIIGLPRDWLNYAAIIESFKTQYGIKVTELAPDASSEEVLSVINTSATTREAIAPDVVDISYAFGQQAIEGNLLQPYLIEQWTDIPDSLKDKNGFWTSAYYGVVSYAVNKAVVAQTPLGWADLTKSVYAGQFAFTGDPHDANQTIQSIYAATFASGGSLDDARPGLVTIAGLRDAGSLSKVMATPTLFFQGDTPIIPVWSYIAHGLRIQAGSNPLVEVVIPKSTIAGAYVQAISAYAPHPYAARLWLEHLFSDDVQMLWANAHAIPTRAAALMQNASRSAIFAVLGVTADLLADIQIPTMNQLTAAKAIITEQWDSVVSVNIKAVE